MEKVISRSLIITLFLFSTILQASERIYKSSILLDSPNNEFVKKAKSVRFLDYLKEVKTYLKQLDSNQKHQIEKRQKENQAFRPSSCPLKSTKYQTISAKIHLVMEELKNNPKCSNALEGTFKNINESLDKLKVLEDDYKTNYDLFNEDATTKTETEIENEKSELLKRKVVINGVQSMLTSFTTVASNSECQETMTATQITSNLSDAIFGISGLGLLAPGAAGYGTAVGGMAIGSLLKVISILIKPTWDFEKDKDRNNFVKISCSLFDLKTDIEEAGLLSNRTTETSSEAKSIQRIINEIDEHIGILNASSYNYSKARYVFEKPLMIKALSTTKEGFNDPNVRLHQHFLKTRNILAAAINANNSDERADILIDLFDIHQKIQGILSKSSMSLKVNRVAKFRDLPTSKIEWKKVVLGAKSGDELWQKVLKNRKTEKEDFKNFTDNFMNIIKWLETYQHSLIRKKKGGFSKVLSDPRFKAKMIIKKLINYRSSLDDRLNFLNSLAVGRVFSDSDDGAINKTNILKNLRIIQDKIYGKVGKRFMEYLSDDGMKSINEFNKRYKSIQPQIDSFNKKQCPEALNLRLLFNDAQTSANLGYDFLQANKDSFYSPKHSWLIFSKGWNRSRLMDHYQTSNEVRELINANRGNIPSTAKNTYKKIAFNTLGAIMFELSSKYKSYEHVLKFISKNNCSDKSDKKTVLPSWVDNAEI